MISLGLEMHNLAKELWPLNRSITGKGLRETLSVIRKHIPNIKITNIATGKKILGSLYIHPSEKICGLVKTIFY